MRTITPQLFVLIMNSYFIVIYFVYCHLFFVLSFILLKLDDLYMFLIIPGLDFHAGELIRMAFAHNSRRTYRSAFAKYLQFCCLGLLQLNHPLIILILYEWLND